jgi:CheY-like chemotaxis protein
MADQKVGYIVIVEDDPEQADFVKEKILRRLPRYDVQIVETESEFLERLPVLLQSPPAVAAIDIILRWSNPDKIPQRTPEVEAGTIREAGLRCEQLLRKSPVTARIPVILYTVTNGKHYEEFLATANKERHAGGYPEVRLSRKDPDVTPLIDAIFEGLK